MHAHDVQLQLVQNNEVIQSIGTVLDLPPGGPQLTWLNPTAGLSLDILTLIAEYGVERVTVVTGTSTGAQYLWTAPEGYLTQLFAINFSRTGGDATATDIRYRPRNSGLAWTLSSFTAAGSGSYSDYNQDLYASPGDEFGISVNAVSSSSTFRFDIRYKRWQIYADYPSWQSVT